MEYTKDLIKKARGWIADSFSDAPEVLTDAEVMDAVKRHYEGGVPQFIEDSIPIAPSCRYAAAHTALEIPATTVIDCGPVGMVPACQQCANFYASH